MISDLNKYNVILASKSPRRQELLKLIVENFSVYPSNIQEPDLHLSPENTVMELSKLKAEALSFMSESIIIGSDTVVSIDNMILGKPKDKFEAEEMLLRLSDNAHNVYTGVTVLNTKTNNEHTGFEKTTVYFDSMSQNDINNYILSGEPFDKAGAYGIQGTASKFIKGINGCYFNVVGLPVHLTYSLIIKALND